MSTYRIALMQDYDNKTRNFFILILQKKGCKSTYRIALMQDYDKNNMPMKSGILMNLVYLPNRTDAGLRHKMSLLRSTPKPLSTSTYRIALMQDYDTTPVISCRSSSAPSSIVYLPNRTDAGLRRFTF